MASAAPSNSPTVPTKDNLAVDSISYEDLYARWERGNWCVVGLNFTREVAEVAWDGLR